MVADVKTETCKRVLSLQYTHRPFGAKTENAISEFLYHGQFLRVCTSYFFPLKFWKTESVDLKQGGGRYGLAGITLDDKRGWGQIGTCKRTRFRHDPLVSLA